MNLNGFFGDDGFWMMAKEWIDVQRQGKLEAMSRKLAGGSQKQHRQVVRVKVERSKQWQIAGVLAVLAVGAGLYEMNRPEVDSLIKAIPFDTVVEAVSGNPDLFQSLKIQSGPGTAQSLGGFIQGSTATPYAARVGTNGLQE
jgi:hypothetical protein